MAEAEATKPVKAPRDYEIHKSVDNALNQQAHASVTVEHKDGSGSTGISQPMAKVAAQNYEVHNPEIQSTMREIGKRIGRALPPRWGFAVFIFDEGQDSEPRMSAANPGEQSSVFYISSHERRGVIETIKAWVRREEGKS